LPESKAVTRALASGYVFDAGAFDAVSRLPPEFDVEGLVDTILERKRVAGDLARLITEEDVKASVPNRPERNEPVIKPIQEEPDVEVLSDPTPAIAPIQAVEGFRRLFQDRYARLLAIVKERPDARSVQGTSAARGLAPNQKTRIAGLLTGKQDRRSNVEFTLDDPSGTVRLSCQDERLKAAVLEAPLDSMVIAEVSKGGSGRIYANSVMLPDIPDKRVTSTSHRRYAVLLSDLHIGSKMFLAEDFQRLVRWLNGGLGDADVVSRIKYVVVAGDLVDGVGVYPGQEHQLSERDLKKQYDQAADLMSKIPGRMQVLIGPGNHDAVRQALPQPAVAPDLADNLYGQDNVRLIGNPAFVKLDGVSFLVYHGKSLDDLIALTPGLEYAKPAAAMKLLLRARHLSPIYGKRTALSPELRDFMVIDTVPDVLHCGHVHTFDEATYRGTLIVNSGTWQAQTSFQSNMGLEPTPSIIPIVDLSDLSVIRRNFGATSFAGAS
jgi:DNA polymerase II small subunit